MKQKVTIKIKSRQDIVGAAIDQMENKEKGFLHKKRGIYYLVYKDHSEGLDGARTTLKIEPQKERVFLTREKPAVLKQIFQPGERKKGIYHTSTGRIQIKIKTELLEIEVSNGEGEICIIYNLYLNNNLTSKNRLEIYFEEKGIDVSGE